MTVLHPQAQQWIDLAQPEDSDHELKLDGFVDAIGKTIGRVGEIRLIDYSWSIYACHHLYTLHSSAGVEYTSFEYEYATLKIVEYEYLLLESSTSTQSPSTSTRVLFSTF